MRLSIAWLVVAYLLSQFYRAFLAVLAPALARDIGVDADALATASGIWFLVFAAMQIPVGIMLDRLGPRRTAIPLLALGGGGGAVLFALAQGPLAIHLSMALIGIGCAPVLMASYYIFARTYRPAIFATLAGAMVGTGTLGNVAASLPLALAVEAIGWRGAMAVLAGITLTTAIGLLIFLRDPPPLPEEAAASPGGLLTVLARPALWPIMALMIVNYAPAAGLRGLWAGPYFADMQGLDGGGIGRATLAMGLAMVAGSFAYGPLDRIFGTRKWVAVAGNGAGLALLIWLILHPALPAIPAVIAFAAIGFACSTYPLLIAHARALFPPHLTGRGVTLMNLCGIGGAGVMQVVTGRAFDAAGGGQAGYQAVFAAFAISLGLGLALYLFSRDTID